MNPSYPGVALAAACLLAACGHPGHDAPGSDAARSGDSGSGAPDGGGDALAPDAAPGGGACFDEWGEVTGCPAPQIEAAYLTTDCEGTTGVFVVGHGFESANLYMVDNGWLPEGPAAQSSRWNDNFWNVLTPTLMCLTTSADASYWSGFDLQLKNPDGQLSNTVTVANDLGSRPPLVSTGSDDPFDLDACLDPGMTRDQALATFAMGASASTLGSVSIGSRTRSCNTATGCEAWGSPQPVASGVAVGLALAGGGTRVDLTMAGSDCGELGNDDQTLTYNSCSLSSQLGGDYRVHVAAHCLQVSQVVRSAIAGDGSYTETDAAALLRY